jgi:hypothetical protein
VHNEIDLHPVGRESEPIMNKLPALFLVLVCAVATAHAADTAAPITVQVFSDSNGVKLGGGLDVSAQRQNLGLRIDSKDWSFNLAVPQVFSSTTLPIFGVGAAWNFSPASSLGVNYRVESNLLPDAPAARTLGLTYGYQLTTGLRLSTNLGRGLTDTGPRWGAGLSISFTH